MTWCFLTFLQLLFLATCVESWQHIASFPPAGPFLGAEQPWRFLLEPQVLKLLTVCIKDDPSVASKLKEAQKRCLDGHIWLKKGYTKKTYVQFFWSEHIAATSAAFSEKAFTASESSGSRTARVRTTIKAAGHVAGANEMKGGSLRMDEHTASIFGLLPQWLCFFFCLVFPLKKTKTNKF